MVSNKKIWLEISSSKSKKWNEILEFMANIIVIVHIFVLIPGASITLKKFK